MELLIVTGMSGAGKTSAMHALEDIGFFCVDNLPPELIPVFYDLCESSQEAGKRVAVGTDTRGGVLFNALFSASETLKAQGKAYKMLFLDCADSVLVRRFKETRRKHPQTEGVNGSLTKAVALEREKLASVKERSDYVMDTTGMSANQLKNRVLALFLKEIEDSLTVHCISFGYRNGIPLESDLVFDVRCFPNPYYDPLLRPMTGLDRPIMDFVLEKEETKGFLDRLVSMLDYLIPLYRREGKSQLVIAVGCTGGHHRSVAIAQFLCDHLLKEGLHVGVTHRDILK